MMMSREQQYLDRLAEIQTVVNLPRVALATIPNDAPWHLLTERERDIIGRRKNGDTLRAIGQALGVTSDRVRQIEQRALRILHRRSGYATRQKQYARDPSLVGTNRLHPPTT
jgi:DNA-directed RNA polymerase sigma subunit (sigma70/sigma32)